MMMGMMKRTQGIIVRVMDEVSRLPVKGRIFQTN